MFKKSCKFIISILIVVLVIFSDLAVNAASSGGAKPPEKPSSQSASTNGMSGGPGGILGGSSKTASYSGANTISSDTNTEGNKYETSEASKNALLVSGGTSILSNITVTKSGDESSESSDFYGTNAGILAYNGASVNIKNSNIETNGAHANAVFAYGTGKIDITDSTIKTSKNNSGAIMVTGGGNLVANNVTATTQGNSSAPIRSDRGGGELTVNGGSYTANGVGSPAIYSTADITVNNATLTSTASEGAIVEGKNSITLNNTTLTDTNTTLNGQSETYKNIFLYQSMSGDADEGTASFTAKDSKITTNKGDTIFVTNTTATIYLENNTIVNNDKTGAFLRVQAGKWGNSGSNGGNVTLNAVNQKIEGDIIVDNISTLSIKLSNSSNYIGTINSDNKAKKLEISLDKTSTLTLTGDSYVTSLNNEVSDNSNINLNGFTLYVNGTAIKETNYTGENFNNILETKNENEENNEITNNDENDISNNSINTEMLIAGIVLVIIIVIIVVIKSKKKKE